MRVRGAQRSANRHMHTRTFLALSFAARRPPLESLMFPPRERWVSLGSCTPKHRAVAGSNPHSHAEWRERFSNQSLCRTDARNRVGTGALARPPQACGSRQAASGGGMHTSYIFTLLHGYTDTWRDTSTHWYIDASKNTSRCRFVSDLWHTHLMHNMRLFISTYIWAHEHRPLGLFASDYNQHWAREKNKTEIDVREIEMES